MKHHLSTLSVLHYVYGALVCVIGLFLLFLIPLGHFMNSDWLAAHSDNQPPPHFVGHLIMMIGWILFVFVEIKGILNIISARNISLRKGRTLSQVVAALDCLNIPFGVALGVFTFITLADPEVKREYGSQV